MAPTGFVRQHTQPGSGRLEKGTRPSASCRGPCRFKSPAMEQPKLPLVRVFRWVFSVNIKALSLDVFCGGQAPAWATPLASCIQPRACPKEEAKSARPDVARVAPARCMPVPCSSCQILERQAQSKSHPEIKWTEFRLRHAFLTQC